MRATRARVMELFRVKETDARIKADGSTLTQLDLELEERIAEVLLGLDPGVGVVGEEHGTFREGTPTWYLDPLDGSANYARRVGCFGSQAVLLEGNRPLFAAVYEPLTDVFTWAAEGAGLHREGRRVSVADTKPERAVVYVDIAGTGIFADDPTLAARIRKRVYKLRSMGSIAIHLRDVAVGVTDAFVGGRGAPSPLHDMAPGVLLVREGGGICSDVHGGDPFETRESLVAGTPAVHAALVELLSG